VTDLHTLPAAVPSQLNGHAVAGAAPETPGALEVVTRLVDELATAGVAYCHWKSNEAVDASASGDNDLDLLVRRADSRRFEEVLARLGFTEARPPAERELPGIHHYYALDHASGRWAHVHSQYHLVLGDDMTKGNRVPAEERYVAASGDGGVMPVAAPAHELALLVIRLVLKRSTLDAQLFGLATPARTEVSELAWLRARVTAGELDDARRELVPWVDDELWSDCLAAVEPGAPRLRRALAARRLERAMAVHARMSPTADAALRVARRLSWGFRSRVLHKPVRKRLVTGGAIVAVIGGDGAGKSTTVEHLSQWLGSVVSVQRAHLGKPPRSLLTLAVKAPLWVGRAAGMFPDTREPVDTAGEDPGLAWVVWHALTARDRRRAYVRARRAAARGDLVVCDRFPLEQVRGMDGARTAWLLDRPGTSGLVRTLARYEKRCYAAMQPPDVLLVMRLDPEVAVARGNGDEPSYVRRRNTEIFEADWSGTNAVVIDAAQPLAKVQADVREAVWARL
jgi:thymidylate kinase